MRTIYRIALASLCLAFTHAANCQLNWKGRVIDQLTQEPIQGVSIHCANNQCSCGCASRSGGEFELQTKMNCCSTFVVSCIGYESRTIGMDNPPSYIYLSQLSSEIGNVVVSANREGVKRSLAPVAIKLITSKMIQETKAASIDQVLNKVSGVYMVNLGNEQHSMSIRQPITTRSLFLYLEDGIPVRTTGLFNHNALLEINMASVKNIEVIKGPSSSLYGSEAIGGVVNFITAAPPLRPTAKISLQGNDIGYRRLDLQTGFTSGKLGVIVSGYVATKQNSYIDYTDFHKATITTRADFRFNEKTSITNSITWLHYNSDMTGSIDSADFATRSFQSAQTFTYREVNALRVRSSLTHSWNASAKTTASLLYRNNEIAQNPAYAIKDDYRKLQNGSWAGKKDVAHGEINDARFESYSLLLQHRQHLPWNQAMVITGASVDLSPSTYAAEYIRIKKDSISNVYTAYNRPDSQLTNYRTGINNFAAFANFEMSPSARLRVVASLRFDLFRFNFDNHLRPSSYSGSPDTVNLFQRFSPKLGFTYNFSDNIGLYANYSEGFVPPQVTEMYKGVKVPNLAPSTFFNYEVGGWASFLDKKLTGDLSIYRMEGTNEIIAVKMDDGSTQNMNAGKTRHEGIEVGLTAEPLTAITLRLGTSFSYHRYIDFVEKGTSYSGNEMNGAPRWLYNAEITMKPKCLKGFRMGVEWQKVGSYFMDPQNTVKYKGYDVFNMRLGYKQKSLEVWLNALNVLDRYYSYSSTKSSSGYSYTPAEPANFNLGLSYDLGNCLKKKK